MSKTAAEAIIVIANRIDQYGLAKEADALFRTASTILAQSPDDLQIYQNNLTEITEEEASLAKEKEDKQKQLEIARQKIAEQQAKEQAEQAKQQMKAIQTSKSMAVA